jgi:hypothetical protein
MVSEIMNKRGRQLVIFVDISLSAWRGMKRLML